MPGTEELAVSLFEWRRRRVLGTVELLATNAIFLVAFLSVPAAFGGNIYWIVTDITVANNPIECFDTIPNCEVVQVVHRFINSSARCHDQYTYPFKLPTSPVVYFQRERNRRADDDCGLSNLLSAANGTFKVGPARCFSVKERFEGYVAAFSCARVFRRKNGKLEDNDCNAIFVPTSDHDPSFAISIGIVLAIYCCLFRTSHPKAKVFRTQHKSPGNLLLFIQDPSSVHLVLEIIPTQKYSGPVIRKQ